MRALRILVAGLFLLGFIAGCGGDKVKTPDKPTSKPTGDPVPVTAPSAPAND